MASFPTVDFSQYQWVVNDTNYLTKHNNLMTALVTMQNNINKFGAESKSESDSAIGIAQSLIEAYSVNVLEPFKKKCTLGLDYAQGVYFVDDGAERLETTDPESILTASRNTAKQTEGPKGTLQESAIDTVARRWSNGVKRGVLIEKPSQNEILYSDDMSNLAWTKLGGAGGYNFSNSGKPSYVEGVNFQRVEVVNSGSQTFLIVQTFTTTVGEKCSLSFNVGKDFNDLAFVQIDTGASNRSIINIQTGSIIVQSGVVQNITVKDKGVYGWWVQLEFEANSTSTRVGVMPQSTDQIGYSKDYAVGQWAEFTAFQFERGGPTSYIPTTSAPVSRDDDFIYRTTSGELGNRALTAYCDIDLANAPTDIGYIWFASTALASSSPWAGLRYIDGGISIATSDDSDVSARIPVSLGSHKIGVSIEDDVFILSIDGESYIYTGTPISSDALNYIKYGFASTNTATGLVMTFSDFCAAPCATTAAELDALTAGGQS